MPINVDSPLLDGVTVQRRRDPLGELSHGAGVVEPALGFDDIELFSL